MRKSKHRCMPNITYDSMMLRAAIYTGERLAFKDAILRAFGKCTCVTLARGTRAAMILYARRHLTLCRAGRSITEVRCTDAGPYTYMQLEACIYLMIRASIQNSTT